MHQIGEAAHQVQVTAGDNGAERHRTAPAGEGHAPAPSQKSLGREMQPGIRIGSIRMCHSMTDD